jgi:GNAT superfamily N-acetyltransferase
VCRIDPGDEAAFDAWYAVVQSTDEERWGDRDGGLSRREIHAATSGRDGITEYHCLAAVGPTGRIVGIGLCELPQRDNRHAATLDIRVAPPYRRHGVGAHILAEAERLLVAAGRSVINATVEVPVGRAASDASTSFARRHGFAATQTGHRRHLALPLAPGLLARLRAEADGSAAGYRLHTFTAPWPSEFLED